MDRLEIPVEPGETAWQYVLGALSVLAVALAAVVRMVVKHRNGRMSPKDESFCKRIERDIDRLDGSIKILTKDLHDTREHLARIEGRLSK